LARIVYVALPMLRLSYVFARADGCFMQIRDIGDPHPIWRLGLKRARQQVRRNRLGVTAIGGANTSATRTRAQLGMTHPARHTLARTANALCFELSMHTWTPIDSATVGKDGSDLGSQLLVAAARALTER
jgi:hypothetical protein